MALYNLYLTRLQNLEFGQFIVRLITDLQQSGLDLAFDVEAKGSLTDIEAQSPIYNAAINQEMASAETKQIAELDFKRDKDIVALKRAISVYQYKTDIARKNSYRLLKLAVDNYHGLEFKNLEAETLGIDKLTDLLLDAQHLSSTNLLPGVKEQVDELIADNNDFKVVFNARSSATISTVVYSTKVERKKLEKLYNDLTTYIEYKIGKNAGQYYIDYLNVINNGRHYFADILAKRQGSTDTPPPATPV